MAEGSKVQEKPSYEQLERMVEALKGQNNQLFMQLQNMNMGNLFKRLDYLFKVIENKGAFPVEFVDKAVTEVSAILTPEQPVETDKTEE